MTMDLGERFWSKVNRDGPVPEVRPDLGPCWLWTRGTVRGYGQFGIGTTKTKLAHRLAYEEIVGPIPDGLELDHLCRTPLCVNPSHLEPVTHAENMRRGFAAPYINRMKTHCPQGHPYDEANTYRVPAGRECLTCKRRRDRENMRRYRAARRAARQNAGSE